MPEYDSPGVYVEELPSGVRHIAPASTAVTAFIGRARKGPVDEPVEITNFSDFESHFGGLWSESTLGCLVRDFFINGGERALVVRVFGSYYAERQVGSPAFIRTITVGSLKFRASSPGSWAGNLGIEIVRSPRVMPGQALDRFELTIWDGSPNGVTEIYHQLGLSGTRRVDQVLARESALLRWDGADLDADPLNVPDFSSLAPEEVGSARRLLDSLLANGASQPEAIPLAREAYLRSMDAAARALSDGNSLVAGDLIGDIQNRRGLFALDGDLPGSGIFNLLCVAPYTPQGDVEPSVTDAAATYCEQRQAMLLVEAPSRWSGPQAVQEAVEGIGADPDQIGTRSSNAAIFFPRVAAPDPYTPGQTAVFAVGGMVAGLLARTDSQRGVWKPAAGIEAQLVGALSLSVALTDADNGLLNPLGINCLRQFQDYAAVLWGARTLRGADGYADQYKYISVRRTALFIEQSLLRGLDWVVFEANGEALWSQIRQCVTSFMHDLFLQGAFAGSKFEDAYFVLCDQTTTSLLDIDSGRLHFVVGFSPLRPQEFVILNFQMITGTQNL